jgi:hypothetical protein
MKTVIFACFSLCIGQIALAQSVPVLRQGQCPTGTYTSGNSCVPTGGTQVFYNGGGPCPQGWTSSKKFCVK